MTRNSYFSTSARAAIGALLAAIAALFIISSTASAAPQEVASFQLGNAKTITPPDFSPAIKEGGFSGLDPIDPFGLTYWAISDRGPNGIVTVAGTDRRTFLDPDFTPTIYKVALGFHGKFNIIERVPLRLPTGVVDPARAVVGGNPNEITGLANTAADPANGIPKSDEKSYNADGTVALPLDPYGVDSESVQQDPRDGSFWISEEYRPSILHVSRNGTLLSRIIPSGTTVAGHTAVPLNAILPNEFKGRRENRGFEGATLSADGKHIYAILQNALDIKVNPTDKPKLYRNARIVDIDISKPSAPKLAHEYVYVFDQLSATNEALQDQLRISELTYLSKNKLVVDERDDTLGTHKTLYTIDLSTATDIKSLDPTGLDGLDAAGLAAKGITPTAKTLFMDLSAAGYPYDKLEGIGFLPLLGLVATVDDDDFGFEQDKATGAVTLGNKPTKLIFYRR